MWYITPTDLPSTFSSFLYLLTSTFFLSSLINPRLRFRPLPSSRPPASAPAAGSPPTAEDVSTQRCCVFPGGWGASEEGGCWWWSESEWAERPQEKPQRVFVCCSVCVGVNPCPMGQHTVSCRSNNGRADPYTWPHAYMHSDCVLVSVQQLTSSGLGSAGSLLLKALCVQLVWRVSH